MDRRRRATEGLGGTIGGGWAMEDVAGDVGETEGANDELEDEEMGLGGEGSERCAFELTDVDPEEELEMT